MLLASQKLLPPPPQCPDLGGGRETLSTEGTFRRGTGGEWVGVSENRVSVERRGRCVKKQNKLGKVSRGSIWKRLELNQAEFGFYSECERAVGAELWFSKLF